MKSLRILSAVFALAVAVALPVSFGACAAFSAEVKSLTPEVEAAAVKDAQCVEAAVVSGDLSAASIAVKCGIPAAENVIAIAGQLATGLIAHLSDGGIGAASQPSLVAKLKAVK